MSVTSQSDEAVEAAEEGAPEFLAALDIGTNSFHLVVAKFPSDDPTFEVVTREKEMVRLGSGGAKGDDMKELEPDAIDRGVAALGRMRQIADIHGATLYAVATSAVREADNAQVFLERARAEADVDVEVITGLEEARLIHLGVLQAVPVFDTQLVLVDIGGGSTEILIGLRGETLVAGSLKLGCIRLTRKFFRSEMLHPAAVDSCRRYVRSALAPMARAVKRRGFEVAVGSSGTIGAVAAIVQAARGDDATPRTLNNFEFTRKEVKAVVEKLAAAPSLDERRKVPGLEPRRADIILAGAIILEQTMNECGITSMVLSDYALREGVLLDARERRGAGSMHHLVDLRRRNVMHLATAMDDDLAHSEQTARLALEIFDGLRKAHGLGPDARELLEAAALLANVGQFVSHDKHHKHTYYVIRNTDQLTGYTDHEIELIALVARYHRKSTPKPSHVEFASLRSKDQRLVTTLAAILRVAIGLDRTHAALVRSVSVRRTAKDDLPRRYVIEVTAADGADLSLELYSANERKELLEQVLDAPVEIVEVTDIYEVDEIFEAADPADAAQVSGADGEPVAEAVAGGVAMRSATETQASRSTGTNT